MTAPVLPTSHQTSGAYLIEVLRARAEAAPAEATRFAMGFDVYIKQQSYAWLNKACCAAAVVLSFATVMWPIVADVLSHWPAVKGAIELVGVAALHTMLTALTGAAIYGYQHYKRRQLYTENILRLIAFSSQPLDRLVANVIAEMSRIDQGLGFDVKKARGD